MELDYDDDFDPPAPALPLLVAPLDGEPAVVVSALVDTGADITVLPAKLAPRIGLRAVASLRVDGIGGAGSECPVYAARLQVAGVEDVFEVVGLGDEALLGRDVLRRLRLVLDGPRGRTRT